MVIPYAVWGFENLDELEARAQRKITNVFYSGESASNSYIWQPITMTYTDNTSGHEVTLFSQLPNVNCGNSVTEYGWQPWSADGKRIAISIDIDVGSYTRTDGYPWFVARSDGSYLRPLSETVNRTTTRQWYFDWSPSEPNVVYHMGLNRHLVTGKDQNAIYKVTVSDNTASNQLWVDILPGDTSTSLAGNWKNAITPDGKLYVTSAPLEAVNPLYIIDLENKTNKLNYNLPTLDSYWGNTVTTDNSLHDEEFLGNSSIGYWIDFYTAGERTHWRMRPWGTDNLAPVHSVDHSSPYDWWVGADAQKEVQVLNGSPYDGPLPDFAGHYWSHNVGNRWGDMMAFSDGDLAGGPGLAVWDIANSTATGGWANGGSQYSTWTAWSDYIAGSVGPVYDRVGIMKYNSNLEHSYIAYLHSRTTGDLSNPAQSPDGTKVAMRSDWLNPTAGIANLFVAVAYYPYPPEITGATYSGGNVTITWDYRHTTGTPRTYTTRGWPNPASDNPPSPREVAAFRLWSSTDNATWTPVSGTVMYSNVGGAWADNSWSKTVAQGNNTTRYYAVTAIEHSGLESGSLSNTWKVVVGAGSLTSSAQQTAYPANPGGKTNFYTNTPVSMSAPTVTHCISNACSGKTPLPNSAGQYWIRWSIPTGDETIRYFNIYALDGDAPTASQTRRIYSIPKSAFTGGTGDIVDWLGNTSGNTRYLVTAVDYQGNESGGVASPAPDGGASGGGGGGGCNTVGSSGSRNDLLGTLGIYLSPPLFLLIRRTFFARKD